MTNSVIRQGFQGGEGEQTRLERLADGDALPPAAVALVEAGQAEGHRFLDQVLAFWSRPGSHYADPRACILLAWQGARAVGIAGLTVDPYAGDPRIGRLKHVYVMPAARRQGIAEAMVRRILAEASGHWTRLRLRAADPAAARLYERLGFRPAPGESDATHVLDPPPPRAGRPGDP